MWKVKATNPWLLAIPPGHTIQALGVFILYQACPVPAYELYVRQDRYECWRHKIATLTLRLERWLCTALSEDTSLVLSASKGFVTDYL